MRSSTEPAEANAFRTKMRDAGMKKEFIEAWIGLYTKYCDGDRGMIAERSIEPITELKEATSLPEGDPKLLAQTVILKLNGGLGTSMGLEKAKSLLEVKADNTFLDLIAKQIIKLRESHPVRFMLLNSLSTEQDTRAFFKNYPSIYEKWDEEVSFMQNIAPKVDKESKKPASWPSRAEAEWYPPGHGDIYAALVVSGKLQKLLDEGYKYMFVSNSDNLGATMDLRLLGYLASSGAPMVMEVCQRCGDDKKGGHLAKAKGSMNIVLREYAQCPAEDEADFMDIQKHRFFNTNNLWLNLDKLKAAMKGGVLPLPLIVNEKKMDPSSKENSGPQVLQLETAMGAAISSLPGSDAIVVPHDRFAPVKTCNQLFALRSDAYVITDDFKPALAAGACRPLVDFDDNYKMVQDMEKLVPYGMPSLKECRKLKIRGKVVFDKNVKIRGEVEMLNGGTSVPRITGCIVGDADQLRILRNVNTSCFAWLCGLQ